MEEDDEKDKRHAKTQRETERLLVLILTVPLYYLATTTGKGTGLRESAWNTLLSLTLVRLGNMT